MSIATNHSGPTTTGYGAETKSTRATEERRFISVPTYEQMIRFNGNDWTREGEIFKQITRCDLETDVAIDEMDSHIGIDNVMAERWRLTKTLSIVIPVGPDRHRELRWTLLGLGRQKYLEQLRHLIEIVIVVDGRLPKDRLADAIPRWVPKFQNHPRIRVCELLYPRNGANVARNVGIYYADGDIILFLDSDMLLQPNFLFEHLLRHQYLQNIALAGFREDIDPNERGDWIKRFVDNQEPFEGNIDETWLLKKKKLDDGSFVIHHYDGRESPLAGCFMSFYDATDQCKSVRAEFNKRLPESLFGTGCSSVARQHITAAGGFQQEYRGWGMEDTDIGSRLLARGVRLIPCRFTMARHITTEKNEENREASNQQELERNKARHDRLMAEPFRENSRYFAEAVEGLLVRELLYPLYEIDLNGRYMPFRASRTLSPTTSISSGELHVTVKTAVNILFERANRRAVELSKLSADAAKLPQIWNGDLRWTLMLEKKANDTLVTVSHLNTEGDLDHDWALHPGTGIRGTLLADINGIDDDLIVDPKLAASRAALLVSEANTEQDLITHLSDEDENIVASRVGRHEMYLIHYKALSDDDKRTKFGLSEKQIGDTSHIAFYACYPIRLYSSAPERFRCVGVFTVHSDQEHLLPYFKGPNPQHPEDCIHWVPEAPALRTNRRGRYIEDHGDIGLQVSSESPPNSPEQLLYIISSMVRDVRRNIEQLVHQAS